MTTTIDHLRIAFAAVFKEPFPDDPNKAIAALFAEVKTLQGIIEARRDHRMRSYDEIQRAYAGLDAIYKEFPPSGQVRDLLDGVVESALEILRWVLLRDDPENGFGDQLGKIEEIIRSTTHDCPYKPN